MNGAKESAFQKEVWQYYRAHGRHGLPWRTLEADGQVDPYKVLVSEIMLQQTQVPRVIPKFEAFIRQFPSFTVLAAAPLGDVLKAWSGLGYNRRAKFLWQTAQVLAVLPRQQMPTTVIELSKLPGIGKNTAGAVLAYAFNKPVVFIETNIRTVFIHHFFVDGQLVRDRDIADVVARELPDNPREWYWALMDYGANLKQTRGNASRKSAHYTKQTAFAGSKRQVRGLVLKVLGERAKTTNELTTAIADERLGAVLTDLLSEGLIIKQADKYML